MITKLLQLLVPFWLVLIVGLVMTVVERKRRHNFFILVAVDLVLGLILGYITLMLIGDILYDAGWLPKLF